MLLAAVWNDQTTFDGFLADYLSHKNSNGLMAWKGSYGGNDDRGANDTYYYLNKYANPTTGLVPDWMDPDQLTAYQFFSDLVGVGNNSYFKKILNVLYFTTAAGMLRPTCL